jgi:acyl carrier protein phosphodiesterase
MNFIAHFHLSKNQTHFIVGNYLADLIHHKELVQIDKSTMEGIYFHRSIDSFTDQHPGVKTLKRLLSPYHGKYSGVVLDILFDYCLFLHWNRLSTESFDKFKLRIYDTLESHISLMPIRLQLISKQMIEQDWLVHYTQESGLRKVFLGVKKRAAFGANLELGFDTYEEYKDEIHSVFTPFYKELSQFCQKYTSPYEST